MEVIVGTYNQILFGFGFHFVDSKEKKGWQFVPLFTDQGHAGCIKSVATGGRYLASGSTDETIRLFDLKKHIEVGTLVQQNGSITCLEFCGQSHMLSGSDDGTVCIWKSKRWEVEKILKGHRAGVNSISLHPSGRLALSVSKDKTVRTWNLLTGRPAYTTNIKAVGEIVRWSPKGNCYAIVVGSRVTVYKIGGAEEPIVYTCDKSILQMLFINDSVLLLAGESEDIILYNFEKKLVLQRIAAHKIRTKAVCIRENPDDPAAFILFTVASDGNLKAWSLKKDELTEPALLLASLDLPGRPTCMTVKLPAETKTLKTDDSKNKSEESKENSDPTVESEAKMSEEEELVGGDENSDDDGNPQEDEAMSEEDSYINSSDGSDDESLQENQDLVLGSQENSDTSVVGEENEEGSFKESDEKSDGNSPTEGVEENEEVTLGSKESSDMTSASVGSNSQLSSDVSRENSSISVTTTNESSMGKESTSDTFGVSDSTEDSLKATPKIKKKNKKNRNSGDVSYKKKTKKTKRSSTVGD